MDVEVQQEVSQQGLRSQFFGRLLHMNDISLQALNLELSACILTVQFVINTRGVIVFVFNVLIHANGVLAFRLSQSVNSSMPTSSFNSVVPRFNGVGSLQRHGRRCVYRHPDFQNTEHAPSS
ncbi:hypothetical protein TNCV_4512861 [Trichonephila clavipes]|nr:hypothetical protein TNCV_4512861 [Trichonephila clavipes]